MPVNHSKSHIMESAKQIFMATHPEDSDLYNKVHLTNEELYNVLGEHFPKMKMLYTKRQIALMFAKDKAHFGEITNMHCGDALRKGRWLWILNDTARGNA